MGYFKEFSYLNYFQAFSSGYWDLICVDMGTEVWLDISTRLLLLGERCACLRALIFLAAV